VDGYRFDMSKGFTQKNSYPDDVALWGHYDSTRVAILKNYANVIHAINPKTYVILEHFADNDEETELSADGMLLWGNLNNSYNQATEGWNTGNSDFSGISYEKRGWADPHLVGYMESHDEERLMYRNIIYGNTSNSQYNVRDTSVGLQRNGMAATFFYTIPGPKMIWQFGELGYDYSINYPCLTSDCRLDPKPIRWDYYQDWSRRYLFHTCSALIGLKKNNPAFKSTTYSMALAGALKIINIQSAAMNVVVVGNFDVHPGSLIPGFTQTGSWYDFFSGDTLNVTNITDHLTLQPGEYHLYTTVKLPKPLFTGVDEPGNPVTQESSFSFVYPNPSSGMFTIQFTMSGSSQARLTITDLYGRPVMNWSGGLLPAGTHSVQWNATKEKGIKVAPGIYFYHIEAGNRSETKKIIVQ